MDEWVNSKNSGKSKRLKTPSYEQIDQKLYEWLSAFGEKICQFPVRFNKQKL